MPTPSPDKKRASAKPASGQPDDAGANPAPPASRPLGYGLGGSYAGADSQLAAIVAASEDAIISKTLDGTILTWNASAERLFGWTASEAIGQPITLIIPPELRAHEAHVIAELKAGRHIRHYATVRMRKNGTRVHVSLSVSPIRDANGQIVMAAKILRDMTREHELDAEHKRLLDAEIAARVQAQQTHDLLELQAQQLEEQAAELEATVDDLSNANRSMASEQMAAERARAEAERATRTLRTVIDQLPVGLYLVEVPSGRILRNNQKAEELLGHAPAQVVDLSGHVRSGAEHRDGTRYALEELALVRAVTRAETVEQQEIRYRRLDGSMVDLIVSAAPIRESDGSIKMAVCTFLDATARQTAERALAEREALLHGLFDAPGVMMFVMEAADDPIMGTDYRFLAANSEACAWLGADESQVVNHTARAFGVSDNAMRGFADLFAAVRASGKSVSLEVPSASRVGAWLRMSVSPIAHGAKDAERIAILMLDVTEEHEVEEERRRLELLVEHATDLIAVTSPTFEVQYVNRAGLALLGATSLDELRGSIGLELVHATARKIMEAGLISSLRANSRWEGETSLRHLATGAEIPVELTAFSVTDPESGTQLALAFICRAIGERQRLQQELRQAQKMEAVGRLAGGIAHDFNNLLTVILSYSELLTDVLPVNAPMRAEVEEIRLAGIRAAALTRQLLAFSRQQVLQPKIVNLNEVVAGTDKMLQRLIGEDVELLTVLTPELGDALLDPGQIEQVIMNLAVNSRDAMPDGGKLTIETADVMLEETLERFHEGMSPGPHVMLAVTDTGIGMDKETQSRIFEPFFTTKSPENGTGLGLSTVFGIVKQSGGGIWVYSEVGRGTTIKIYFPRVGREGAPSAPPTTSAPSRGGETVLLVEDDERVRVVAAAGLQRFGYDVLTALTVEDAVHLCEHHRAPIHLLLTDVIMPRMNGPALAEQLRTLRPDMKVLFMSGYTNRSIVNNTILDANTAFIQKPITPERLAHKIRDVLDGTPRS